MEPKIEDPIRAIKADISQAIARHLDPSLSPPVKFGIASTAVSESLADLIFAAGRNKSHGLRLLAVCLEIIETRWERLARTQ